MPDGCPDGPDEGDLSPVYLLEGGTGPSWWHRGWVALPPAGRRFLVGLAVLTLLCGGLIWFRDWSAERELRQVVELTTTLGVVSSSTSPPGGEVRYVVLVHNDGPRPVWVTSIEAASGGLRVRMRDDGDRRVPVDREIAIPMSARLTCDAGADAAHRGLPADVDVRRVDGGSTSLRVDLEPAALLVGVSASLCTVRPGLRDLELSGPVMRADG